MAENGNGKAKKEIPTRAPVVADFNNTDYLSEPTPTVMAPWSTAEDKEKLEIAWPTFHLTGDELELLDSLNAQYKDRYNQDLNQMLDNGVRLLSYRPAYNSLSFNVEDPEGYHRACQELADGYKAGQRAPATGGQKAKAKAFDKIVSLAEKASGQKFDNPEAASRWLEENLG